MNALPAGTLMASSKLRMGLASKFVATESSTTSTTNAMMETQKMAMAAPLSVQWNTASRVQAGKIAMK